MPENIEIKARVRDYEQLKQIAKNLSDRPENVINQQDTFFFTPTGRLKLRIVSPTSGELIFYQRSDDTGPKTSHYLITATPEPLALKQVLAQAIGVRGVVTKTRILYQVGQTRVHLDEVDGLGAFVELEWVKQPGQSIDEGRPLVKQLMQRLYIAEQDLVKGAYIDLLQS